MARAWYVYSGYGAVDRPVNYTFINRKPLCRNGVDLCVIYACYGGLNPTRISDNLLIYIANGLATELAQPQVPIATKKYVYMKNPS